MNGDEFNMLSIDQQVNYINSRLDEDLTLRYVIERELNLPRSTIRNRFTRNRYVFNKRANRYIKTIETKDTKLKNKLHNLNVKEESNKNITVSNIDIKNEVMEKNQWSNMNITKSNIGVNLTENEENNKIENILNLNTNKNHKGSNMAMDKLKDETNIDIKLNEMRKKIKSNIDITKSNMEIRPLENTEVTELRDILKHKDAIINLLENKPLIKPNNIDISTLSGDLKVKTLKIYDSVLKEFNKFIKDHKELKQQDIVSLALKEFLERHS